jgi:hypothetical protein
MKFSLILLFTLLLPLSAYSLTLVYNLRIAEATKRQKTPGDQRYPSIASFTLVDHASERRDGTHYNYIGGLATYYYATESLHAEIDTAAAHVCQKKDGASFSRTQFDDILFSGGWSVSLNERSRATVTGMIGIPTHKDLSPEGVQFGTGHGGVGIQLDGSFFYSKNYHHFIAIAGRYLRFFPRTIHILINDHATPFRFNIGNVVDLFISHSSNWERHHVEVGYNPTFLFEASIYPSLALITEQTNYIRSSFFGSYRYLFLVGKHASGISTGLSYGFDHIPSTFGF